MNLRWRTIEDGTRVLVDSDRRYGDRTLARIDRVQPWGESEAYLRARFTYKVNSNIPAKVFSLNEAEEAKKWLEVVTTMTMS